MHRIRIVRCHFGRVSPLRSMESFSTSAHNCRPLGQNRSTDQDANIRIWARTRARNSVQKIQCCSIWSNRSGTMLSTRLLSQLADSVDGSKDDMDYHLEIINKDDELRVLKFLRRSYFRDEPLSRSIQLIPEGEDSTCMELEDYFCYYSLENNLSLKAVSANGTIVAVLLNDKIEPPSNEVSEYIRLCKNAKCKKLLQLYHHMHKIIYMDGQFWDSKVFSLTIISVDANWRKKGVAIAIIKKSIEIAKEQGFHYAVVNCTSFFSAKLCMQLGFDAIYHLNYNDYVDEDGKPIFSPVSPHTTAVIYMKKLCG